MRTSGVRGALASLLLLLCASASPHAYYVTVCQIDHNVETKALEITFQFFTDDLELALRGADGDDVRLVRGSAADDADAHLLAYLQRKFDLRVNERPAELRYVGKEVELDSTYVYLEALDTPRLSKAEIRSSILLELFEDHTTIVHVRTVGAEKSVMLRKDAETDVVEFIP